MLFLLKVAITIIFLLFTPLVLMPSSEMNSTSILPEITITFAGNPLDSGGPYWAVCWEDPPYFFGELGIEASKGYYTNNSKQLEDWILIQVSVTPGTYDIDSVWLHWLNITTWTNQTYEFTHLHDTIWEFQSQGIITPTVGCTYSFDVVAIDTQDNKGSAQWSKKIQWNITSGGTYTRRWIQLGCTPTEDITYTPYYLYTETPETGVYQQHDTLRADHLHHDQGAADTLTDTGYLSATLPTDTVSLRYCRKYIGYYFEDTVCIEPTMLENLYVHVWWSTTTDHLKKIGWGRTRAALVGNNNTDENHYETNASQAHSALVYDNENDSVHNTYHLETRYFPLIPTLFSDNSIYEFYIEFMEAYGFPSCISNRSFLSFVVLNVPENETLNTTYSDSDGDGLSDWTELYRTYTHPFLSDTDNDGATDSEEVTGADHGYNNSDPNDYTDTTVYRQLFCDLNDDGRVNIDDVFMVIIVFGTTGEPGWIPEDLNDDGKISVDDLFLVLKHWT